MDKKKGYTALNLPVGLVSELKVWKTAFSAAYGRTVSYAEMLRVMIAYMSSNEPHVYDEFKRILEAHPELKNFGSDE